MKIHTMTATFGKLENQTLNLEPGLNIFTLPNEWGKTTWCTFLVTMLYGLDTREKTTKTALAVKEHYAPWSGSPMSGRIELSWKGRNITIERWSKGRTPLGEFRAYETDSGLEIPELTGSNCGEMLLGVEKSVFLRAGFLRLSDLPVTADESLRRRLNALVTTGDESGAGDELAQKLKELKNKCRFNRTGLIPQTEGEKAELENKLTELQNLEVQAARLTRHQQELQRYTAALENHLQHLNYDAALANARRLEEASRDVETAAENMAKLEEICAAIPSRETAMEQLRQHGAVQQRMASLLQKQAAIPPDPPEPQIPAMFRTSPEKMCQDAEKAARQYAGLKASKRKQWLLWLGYGLVGTGLLFCGWMAQSAALWMGIGAAILLCGIGTLVFCLWRGSRIRKEMEAICGHCPGVPPQKWVAYAAECAEKRRQYQQTLKNNRDMQNAIRSQLAATQTELDALTGELDSRQFLLQCDQTIARQDALTEARRVYRQAVARADTLRTLCKVVAKPETEDTLAISPQDTQQQLTETDYESRQLQLRLGQCLGRMEALGDAAVLRQSLERVNARLERLEQTYRALELAQQTLQKATNSLQRRFAPRIARRTQEIFSRLTGGRYNRLSLTQELSIDTAADGDAAIRSALWRSDGTVDQLYLALRLAVAGELMPHSPLVLDDALVRFDDDRLRSALEILQAEGEQRQVIVFTCQSREANLLG